MTPQMYVAPAVFVKLPEKKKKSACKINENDLKIAWKCTLRLSNFKNFPGEDPRTPLMRGTPSYTLPLSRLTSLDTCLRQSMPPPPVFRPSGSSPVTQSMRTGPEDKSCSCSAELSMKCSIVGILIFISRNILSSAMFNKKEYANVSNLRFIYRTNFMFSCFEHEKNVYNLQGQVPSFRLSY